MNYVVLLAGGIGSRMNSKIAKQHLVVMNHQIIEYTLKAFSNSSNVDCIIVVSNKSYVEQVENLMTQYSKLKKVIVGGKTRICSVRNAISYLSEICGNDDKIIISDGARPCVTTREIDEIFEKLNTFRAITTGIENYETLLKIDNNNLNQIISRDGIIRQTSPEGYVFSVLKWLYIDATDEIVSAYKNIGIDQLYGAGLSIGIVKSNPLNFKITTKDDLVLFNSVLKSGFENFINQGK